MSPEHNVGRKGDGAEKVELPGCLLVDLKEIGGKDAEVEKNRVEKTFAREKKTALIPKVVQSKPALLLVVAKIPGDGHEMGKLPCEEDSEENPAIKGRGAGGGYPTDQGWKGAGDRSDLDG